MQAVGQPVQPAILLRHGEIEDVGIVYDDLTDHRVLRLQESRGQFGGHDRVMRNSGRRIGSKRRRAQETGDQPRPDV